MKYILVVSSLIFFLTACAPARTVGALPDVTSTATIVPLESTATFMPLSPTSTATQIPCDPHTVDYCITAGHLILQRPIFASANDSVDKTYRYASTANGTREAHHGVEFLNKYGTPIYAAADGVIVFAGADVEAVYSPWENFYGNLIVIRHKNGLYTLYAHLSALDVQQGDAVEVGDKIGEVGQSGVATGSHLHFEVRIGNEKDYFSTKNPELWLVPEKDGGNSQYGVLAVSIVDEASQHRYAEMTVQRYPKFSDVPDKTYYMDTYVNEMAVGDENAALSDLPPGRYRIALKLNGYLYERWVELQSGKLTQAVIVVK